MVDALLTDAQVFALTALGLLLIVSLLSMSAVDEE